MQRTYLCSPTGDSTKAEYVNIVVGFFDINYATFSREGFNTSKSETRYFRAVNIGEKLPHLHSGNISSDVTYDYETGKALINHEMIIRFALALGAYADEILGLTAIEIPDETPSLRYTRRVKELEQLPEIKQKAILKTLDDLIRANR